ncbi:MAG: hypothetical protein IKK21_03010 [Clostridia bacterium]|nr:hypothetical protein [Clostridia bacterium]
MKKLFAILLAALLGVTAAYATQTDLATGSDLPESVLLTGFVQEITGEYVLLLTRDGLLVQANLTEDTAFMAEGLEIGDFVYVAFNGMMTRSIPAQITVQALGCEKTSGVVEELSEEGFLLRSEEWEDGVFVLTGEDVLANLLVDMPVTVYFDGKVSRSLPPQITALHVRLMELAGVVDELTETGFLMTDAEGVQYEVHVPENAVKLLQPGVGEAVRITYNGVMTMSLPAQVNALEVLPYYETMTIVD